MTSRQRAMISGISQGHEIRESVEPAQQVSHDFILKPEWLEASDSYGWRALARNVVPLLAFLGLPPVLARMSSFVPWLLTPALGLFLYRITVVMHDCTHHTLFTSRKTNARAGLVLGALSGVDFHRFCVQHWRHHRLYGRAGDPQGFHYLELAKLTSGGLLRHLIKPLFGLRLRNVINESLLAPGNLARSVRSGEIVIVALVQTAVLAIVTGLGRHPILAILPFVSGATFGLFFSQLRGIAEHGQLDASGGPVVRSHQPRWLDRVLLYDVNFNCHAEHHAHPQVPSCHLPSLQRATGVPATPKSMFATLHDVHVSRKASRA